MTQRAEPDASEQTWDRVAPRSVEPEDWLRFERSMAEIFTAFGMDLDTPGTARTPQRFLQALYDSTAGYDGDPKLLTAFPTECRVAEAATQPREAVLQGVGEYAAALMSALP